MRFGFGASNFEMLEGESLARAHREMLEQAEMAEELGFDSIWVAEQHFAPERQCPSPFVEGAAIAARTRRIKVGVYTTVTLVHPVRVAEDAAVLDVLSEGRLILCTGTGYRQEEFDVYGIPREEKRPRIEEVIEILRLAWSAEPFTYRGRYYEVPTNLNTPQEKKAPISVFPKPLQQPSIPIWMASFGTIGIRQAAQMGIPCFTSPLESLSELKERYALYCSLQEQTEQSQGIFPVIRTVYVAETHEKARQDVEDSVLTQYRRYRRWRALQDDSAAGFDSLVESRFIVGDPDHCIREIRRYQQEAGINYMVCRMNLPGLSHSKVLTSLRLFAKEVVPGLAGLG